MKNVELIREFKKLLDEGIISQEEFEAKKTEILSQPEIYEQNEGKTVAANVTYASSGIDNKPTLKTGEKCFNKHLFVWVFTFLIGGYGVDRFLRGQIAYGVIKLLTIGGCGVWALVDFIIAAMKAYGASYADSEYVVFDINGFYTK